MAAWLPRYPQVDADGRRHVCRLQPSARQTGLQIRLYPRTAVTDEPNTVELGDDELIEAVTGRLGETSGFSATLRAIRPADSRQDHATDD